MGERVVQRASWAIGRIQHLGHCVKHYRDAGSGGPERGQVHHTLRPISDALQDVYIALRDEPLGPAPCGSLACGQDDKSRDSREGKPPHH